MENLKPIMEVVFFGSECTYKGENNLFDKFKASFLDAGFSVTAPSGYNQNNLLTVQSEAYYTNKHMFMKLWLESSNSKIKSLAEKGNGAAIIMNIDREKEKYGKEAKARVGSSTYAEIVLCAMYGLPVHYINPLNIESEFYDDLEGIGGIILSPDPKEAAQMINLPFNIEQRSKYLEDNDEAVETAKLLVKRNTFCPKK